MALVDEVTSRYGNQYLVNLTNPYDTTATTIDTTRLGLAATDVEAEFEKKGIEYDGSVATHVATAVEAVEILLLWRAGSEPKSKWDKFRDETLDDLKLVTSRDRIMPQTDSVLTPTRVEPGPPLFDDRRFFPLIPGSPRATDDDDED